jgi:hypothetical protein
MMPALNISMLARGVMVSIFGLMLASCGSDSSVSDSGEKGVVALDQGPDWNPTNQAAFYYADQGSWIMPYEWAKAFKSAHEQLRLSTEPSQPEQS